MDSKRRNYAKRKHYAGTTFARPNVWEYRWREPGSDGKPKHRRMVIGSLDQFKDQSSALLAIAALRREINFHSPKVNSPSDGVGVG